MIVLEAVQSSLSLRYRSASRCVTASRGTLWVLPPRLGCGYFAPRHIERCRKMTQPSAAGVLPMSQSSFFADYETPLPPSGELTASAAELGVWLGIAERTARELAVKGVLVRTGSGRYALRPSVQNYVAYVRDQAEATGGTARLVVERAREARERADRLSLQNATARGELVRVADVTATWTATMREHAPACWRFPAAS